MLNQIVLGVGLVISGLFLLRLTFIRIGWLKEPVLRQMRVYGSPYHIYYPLPAVLIWSGIFYVCGTLLLMNAANSRFPAFLIGVVLLFAAYLSLARSRFLLHNSEWLQPYWVRQLASRAEWDEQRRVAWAWLRLPPGLRRRFCLYDKAFAEWADLVILSVGSTQADTFVYALNYRALKTRVATG